MNFYTKQYTFSDKISIQVPSNVKVIDNSSITLYKYLDSYIQIPFSYSFENQTLSIIPSNIEYETIYYVVIQNITNTLNEVLPKEILKFFSDKAPVKRNPNDLYYQLQTIDKFNSIENILFNSENKNFSFNPVEYSIDSKKYVYSKVNSEKVEVVEDVTSKARDLYIQQNAFEYKNFFNDILNKDKIDITTTLSEDDIKKLNLLILENIPKLNALKGTKKLMEFVLGIYARVLNYQLISVVEDKNFNFLYRISSSIPKEFWIKNIKPIVHPCGWYDVYNYIDSIVANQIVDYSKERTNLQKYIRENFVIDSLSELEADQKQRLLLLKQFIHLSGNIIPEYTQIHEHKGHAECNFTSVYGDSKFNTKWGFERNPWQYYLDGINREIYDKVNYKFNISNYDNIYSMEYKTPGIGIEYIWKIFKNNTLIDIRRTPFPKLDVNLNDVFALLNSKLSYGYNLIGNAVIGETFQIFKPQFTSDMDLGMFRIGNAVIGETLRVFETLDNTTINPDIRVELSLKRYEWEKTVFQYDSKHLKQYQAITQDWTNHSSNRKFLDYRAGNLLGASNDSITTESFCSEYNNKTFSITNPIKYKFFDNEINKAVFKAEFDATPQVFNVETEKIDDKIKIKISYKKTGIAKKYIWTLLNFKTIERTFETYLNFVEFYVEESQLQYYEIYLRIENDDYIYDLTNFVIFSIRECNKTKPWFAGLTYKPSFMMYNDIHLIGSMFDNIPVGNFSSEMTANFSKTKYNIEYNLFDGLNVRSDIFDELNLIENYKIFVTKNSDSYSIDVDFRLPGYANKYNWKVGYIGATFRSFETNISKLQFKLADLDTEIFLLLTVERDGITTELNPVYLLTTNLNEIAEIGNTYLVDTDYLTKSIGFSTIGTTFIIN